MENQVVQAAQEGDVSSLLRLLQYDPLILDRVLANCSTFDTPLHIAAMLGHVDFVKEIVRRKPELTRELNLNNSTPLHLASARGFTDVVRALVSVDSDMCFARDKDGRNPLHIAAIKGRLDVLKELIEAKPDAARAILHQGKTILHFCVIYNQFEALKLLIEMTSDEDFLNAKDDDGNTILHLAVADKQTETISYLLLKSSLKVNTRNQNELTPIDVLIQSRRDVKDMDIRESLARAGAVGVGSSEQKNTLENFFNRQQDWLERKRNALMVVASLIATMAFQAAVNPPGGFSEERKEFFSKEQGRNLTLLPGHSIWADTDPSDYGGFLIVNTVGFIASLSIILLLISGLPLRRKIFVWILMVIMWIAITSVAITYSLSIAAITPWEREDTIVSVIGYVIFVWLGLMGILLLGHSICFIIRIVRGLRKLIGRYRNYLAMYVNLDRV